MADLPRTSDYLRLFLNDVPLLDVRAPVEFQAGAFPTAENHPLLDNEDRHRIGIRYKEKGQEAAIELGSERVSGELRDRRIQAWLAFAECHPDGALYCFRGGLRSQISQQWLSEALGRPYPRVEGGYKALRRLLIEQLEISAERIQPLILGGRTGSGKTRLLKRLQHKIDLEALAHHRGSAFGARPGGQPSQIDFENALSIALLKHRHTGNAPLVLEDESAHVGARTLPAPLWKAMQTAPLVLLEADLETRIGNTREEYFVDTRKEFQVLQGEEHGYVAWERYLLDSLDKIQRKLGGLRHKTLREAMQSALRTHRQDGDVRAAFDAVIRPLLEEYYDPMYDYAIERNRRRVRFAGEVGAMVAWLGDEKLATDEHG